MDETAQPGDRVLYLLGYVVADADGRLVAAFFETDDRPPREVAIRPSRDPPAE